MPIKTFVAINDYIYAENNNIIVKYVTLLYMVTTMTTTRR